MKVSIINEITPFQVVIQNEKTGLLNHLAYGDAVYCGANKFVCHNL